MPKSDLTVTTTRLPLLHHIDSQFAFKWTPTAKISPVSLLIFLNDTPDWLPLFRNELDGEGNPQNHTYIEFAKGEHSIQEAGPKGLYFDPDDGTCQRVIDELTTALIGHEVILIYQGDPPVHGDGLGYIRIMLGPPETARCHTALPIDRAVWMRDAFRLLLNQYNAATNTEDHWGADYDPDGHPITYTYGNDPKPRTPTTP